MQSREIIAEISRAAHRSAVGRAVQGHETRGRLGHWIVAWTIMVGTELAEAADRDEDDIRLDGAAMLIADTPLVEGARSEILDDDIGSGGELKENRGSRRHTQIQRKAAFVAIHRRMQKAHTTAFTGYKRAGAPSDLALGRLDLDNVGAEVREHASAHRPGPTGRGFEHAESLQRSAEIVPRLTIEILLPHPIYSPSIRASIAPRRARRASRQSYLSLRL